MTTPALDPVPGGYADALDELETILRDIEDDDVDVDVLAERVARAAGLIEFCRDRIVAARTAVEEATAGGDAPEEVDTAVSEG